MGVGIIDLGGREAWIISLYSLCHDMFSNRTTRIVMVKPRVFSVNFAFETVEQIVVHEQ
jgi:hypothetical protein